MKLGHLLTNCGLTLNNKSIYCNIFRLGSGGYKNLICRKRVKNIILKNTFFQYYIFSVLAYIVNRCTGIDLS